MTGLSNGNALVTWQSGDGQDGSGTGIYGQILNASGGKVGGEFQVNTYTAGHQGHPAVTTLSNGNALVMWQSASQDGSGDGTYGRVLDAMGNKVGDEFLVNTYTTGDQGYPAVTTLSNGNVLVTWQSYSQDGSGVGIYGKIIDTHLTASNTHQIINYQENAPQDLANIIITPPVFTSNITASLTLSDPLAGSLTTTTSGNVTSTYNTGTWQATGNVNDVNALLATVQFQPALNYASNFTIGVSIDDQFNTPLADTMTMIGHLVPQLTTQELTTQSLTTQPLTTQELTSQRLTTSPLTTDSLTTQESTTQGVTTGPLTTAMQSQVTSGGTTDNTVTSQGLTSGSASSTQESTTQKVTTSPASTSSQNPVTSATNNAVTSQSLTSGSVSTTSTEEISGSQPHSNVGIIMGSVIGGLAALATATGLGIFAARRYQKNHQRRQKETVNSALNQEEMQFMSAVPGSKYVNIPGKAEHQTPVIQPTETVTNPVKPIPQRIIKLQDGTSVRLFNNVVLGQGHFGKVVLGERLDTHEEVAVKKIKKQNEFAEELKVMNIMRQIEQDNYVLPYNSYAQVSGRENKHETGQEKLYLVMPFMSKNATGLKRELNKRLEDDIDQKCNELWPIAKDLLKGIKKLHSHHIYHLDLKLDNFMLSKKTDQNAQEKRWYASLIDFNTVQVAETGKLIPGKNSIKGDFSCFSPQRVDLFRLGFGKISNPFYGLDYLWGKQEDAWALGILLFELISGKNPITETIGQHSGVKSQFELIETGTPHWFENMFKSLEETYPWFKSPAHPLIIMVKGFLRLDANKRLTIDQASQQLNLTTLSEEKEQTAYKVINAVPESGIVKEGKKEITVTEEEPSENRPGFGF